MSDQAQSPDGRCSVLLGSHPNSNSVLAVHYGHIDFIGSGESSDDSLSIIKLTNGIEIIIPGHIFGMDEIAKTIELMKKAGFSVDPVEEKDQIIFEKQLDKKKDQLH